MRFAWSKWFVTWLLPVQSDVGIKSSQYFQELPTKGVQASFT